MLNTINYSMTSQFSVLIPLQTFIFKFCFNKDGKIIILKDQVIIYILIFFLIIILLGQKFYRSFDEKCVLNSIIELTKLSISFNLYSFIPYFFNKYLNYRSNFNNIQSEEDNLLNNDSLHNVIISNDDKDKSDQENINDFTDDCFDALQISTIIHLFELIIYFPFAYIYEEEKGQINDLIVRIFLLKRKNMLITSFFTFYLGYKYFIFLLKKISPSSIELIWLYFAFFGSFFGLTYGRDFMAATEPEKILRILGLFIIIVIICIKSFSPPFPSYIPYFDSLIQSTPFYKFIEINQNEPSYYETLTDNLQANES